MDTPLKVDARSPKGGYDKYGKEIVWPKTREEWLAFDLSILSPGTEMPPHFNCETPPDKYIVNGLLQVDLIPKEEQERYRLPNTIDAPEVPKNADGSIIIVDTKTQIGEQQKMIDALMDHVGALTKQVNLLTQNKRL